MVGRPLDLLAYPHGAAGAREARAAEQAGFSLAFTTRWTPCEPETEPLLVGRIEPGPVPLSGFLGVLAGTSGIGVRGPSALGGCSGGCGVNHVRR